MTADQTQGLDLTPSLLEPVVLELLPLLPPTPVATSTFLLAAGCSLLKQIVFPSFQFPELFSRAGSDGCVVRSASDIEPLSWWPESRESP